MYNIMYNLYNIKYDIMYIYIPVLERSVSQVSTVFREVLQHSVKKEVLYNFVNPTTQG